MKILYFGLADELAECVLQELVKEGHSVSAVIDKKNKNKKIKCKIFEYDLRKFDSQICHIMKFVKPEVIIFAGEIMNNMLEKDKSGDFEQMQHILREAEKNHVKKFLYLSSLEVDQLSERQGDASDWCLFHAQQEYMIELAAKRSGMQMTILRAAPMFYDAENSKLKGAKEIFKLGYVVQPIHIKDVAIAVSRLIEEERGDLKLNICGSKAYSNNGDVENNEVKACGTKYSNEEIKRLISWTDYNEFLPTKYLLDVEMKSSDQSVKRKDKPEKRRRVFLRQLVENLILFGLFLIPELLLNDHSLFQQINWMLIYIVVISLYLGIVHSTIAIVIACIVYLFIHDVNIMEITSVYSYLKYLIVIAEYIFFGIAVAYSNNMIRNRLLDKTMDYDLLREDYEELKVVYEQNTRIKDEYEQRMINSQNTIPKLQSVMNKLNVLQPDKIFMEVNYVVSDFLRTNTVAVYRTDKNSSYLRLLASLNENSTFGGKTWNLEGFPDIASKIDKNEIVMGKAWSEEPAMTIPINNGEECIAIIVIRELSLETRSLYYLNMMRTLAGVVSEAMTRALEYERLIEARRYVEGTNVLNPEEFNNQVEIQREMKENNIAAYTVLNVPLRDWREIYLDVDKALRTVDYLGLNSKNELSVILVNTANNECGPVIDRLEKIGIEVQIDE